MSKVDGTGGFGGRLEPERVVFFVMPEFPLYALVPAVEALRLANQNSGQRLFDWQLCSVDGRSVGTICRSHSTFPFTLRILFSRS